MNLTHEQVLEIVATVDDHLIDANSALSRLYEHAARGTDTESRLEAVLSDLDALRGRFLAIDWPPF